MKKSLLLLVFGLGIFFAANAQKKKINPKAKISYVTPPSAINTSFKEKFATVSSAKWQKTANGNFVANFSGDGEMKQSAEFDKNGDWKKTYTNYSTESLPETVKLAVQEKYPESEISEAKKVELKDINPFFQIKIKGEGNKIKQVFVSEEGSIAE